MKIKTVLILTLFCLVFASCTGPKTCPTYDKLYNLSTN